MDNNRLKTIYDAIERSYVIIDTKVYNDITKKHEFRKTTIRNDESLTNNEKSEAIKMLEENYNFDKIRLNIGPEKFCENCQMKYLAITYCENCIRIYLKENFLTSGNSRIDNLIQKCQLKSLAPNRIIEWIPYGNLKDINHFTRGGCSDIYTATWIGGYYDKWDSKKKELTRAGDHEVILKELKNIESANRSWFDEAVSHLTISNKWAEIVLCNGLTQRPNGDYMIVMERMDEDLRTYLKNNRKTLTWERKIKIVFDIATALYFIHNENKLHRDLHSGNALYFGGYNSWYISDLGFCGPADSPLDSIYGNLPYIAPEVIIKKMYSRASDIYSLGMIMWEISSGYPPFYDYRHDYDLTMKIVNGERPKIIEGTPSEYEKLMKQCWNDRPSKRPEINILLDEIEKMWKNSYSNSCTIESNSLKINTELNNNSPQNSQLYYSNIYSTSKVYHFKDLPNNSTYNTIEESHSKPYDFNISSRRLTENNRYLRNLTLRFLSCINFWLCDLLILIISLFLLQSIFFIIMIFRN